MTNLPDLSNQASVLANNAISNINKISNLVSLTNDPLNITNTNLMYYFDTNTDIPPSFIPNSNFTKLSNDLIEISNEITILSNNLINDSNTVTFIISNSLAQISNVVNSPDVTNASNLINDLQ